MIEMYNIHPSIDKLMTNSTTTNLSDHPSICDDHSNSLLGGGGWYIPIFLEGPVWSIYATLFRIVTVPTMQAIPQAVVSSWVTNTFVKQSKLAQDTLTNLRVGTTLLVLHSRVGDAIGAAFVTKVDTDYK